jgi:hypothetical protein
MHDQHDQDHARFTFRVGKADPAGDVLDVLAALLVDLAEEEEGEGDDVDQEIMGGRHR